MKTVSAATANRQFSSLLKDVAAGERVTVLSRGKPVAALLPVAADGAHRKAARGALFERLSRMPVSGERDWHRDELHEAEPSR
ncbi:MAG: hypothetical protein RLZ83_530 [Pseudomonadota bacterium]|jgi:prevent-host-death family protein